MGLLKQALKHDLMFNKSALYYKNLMEKVVRDICWLKLSFQCRNKNDFEKYTNEHLTNSVFGKSFQSEANKSDFYIILIKIRNKCASLIQLKRLISYQKIYN